MHVIDSSLSHQCYYYYYSFCTPELNLESLKSWTDGRMDWMDAHIDAKSEMCQEMSQAKK